ncbi:CdaR family protein [Oribacterium sp. WCC10]|uniref:CdaR family protein n=1 Tax=Oribacterium sp. WCC10 TaxID=1855343 RepID=UPI0008EF93BA|nr:CdaR family protein [Oribacterium sp. WCC10]SFG57369.1 YbbR domain-containing protein [Oribacterium sp. WCC10]
MIKRFFTENLSLKAVSLILAFVIWIMVVNVSKPEISDTKNVQLEVLNQDIFEEDSKTWSVDRSSVNITYNVRSDVRSSISSSDFHAYIKLSDFSITGSVPVYVEVLNGKESIIGDVSPHPSVVRVSIEDVQKKKFDIKKTTVGDPKSGYKAANIMLSPESAYITGPESEIGRISSVGVEIDIANISSNQDGVAKLTYYDANGNTLSGLQGVSANVDEINYSVTVHKEKTINLLSSVTGTPAAGYQYESTTVSPDSVTLAAAPGVIDSMTVFELPEINLNDATESLNITFNLSQYLPAGVELGDDQDPQVNVLVRIEKLPDTGGNPPNGGLAPAPLPAPTEGPSGNNSSQDQKHNGDNETSETSSESSASQNETQNGVSGEKESSGDDDSEQSKETSTSESTSNQS